MRMIDADALDMAFTNLRFNQDMSLAHWGDRKDWCLHGHEVEKLIYDAPTVGGWICLTGHITDVMPEDGVFVLVCNDEGKMMIAKYESELVRWEYKYTNYDWDVWDDEEQGPIRYWMPLPEPPKEDAK